VDKKIFSFAFKSIQTNECALIKYLTKSTKLKRAAVTHESKFPGLLYRPWSEKNFRHELCDTTTGTSNGSSRCKENVYICVIAEISDNLTYQNSYQLVGARREVAKGYVSQIQEKVTQSLEVSFGCDKRFPA
jgi:hypothetical protein